MKIVFLGNKPVGCVGLLTLLAANYEVVGIITIDPSVKELARILWPREAFVSGDILIFDSMNYWRRPVELLVSVHSREILSSSQLNWAKYGGINIHPCLSKYKGVRPIERLLADKGTLASVGAHWMIEEVDAGRVIYEKFIDISGSTTVAEVYNKLYPHYSIVLLEALRIAWLPQK